MSWDPPKVLKTDSLELNLQITLAVARVENLH